ncbi:MAG: CotH kinase family protein, partial [Cyclonatronaceae bacterium]
MMFFSRFFFSLFVPVVFFGMMAPGAQAQLINEIQASNAQTMADEDGEFEDWIELYNPTDEVISLNGFGLSDDAERPFRWEFPDISLEPGAFLLVWASGKNRRTPGQPLHTNFKISADGEPISLSAPDGQTADEIPPLELQPDISYGRKPDGSTTLVFFTTPTPGASNTTEAYEGILAPPVFSHPGGLYSGGITLELSAEQEAEIRYTTNGSRPEANSGSRYSGPLSISNSGIIRARAFKNGYIPSQARIFSHIRLNGDVENFSSDLPLVVMHQFLFGIGPGERKPVSMMFLQPGEDGRTRLSGNPDLVMPSLAEANIRGTSSQEFPKKMYGFHLRDDDRGDRSEALFGLPPEHNWILYAPYSDKSLMRNAIAYDLARAFGRWAPRTQFVEVFEHLGNAPLSQSSYHGVYLLVERIKWDENRVNIHQLGPGDETEPEISGGYIIKKARLDEGQAGFTTPSGTTLGFVRPQEEDATPAQKSWIQNYMSAFEAALYGPDFDSPAGYASYIDTDSFIDHFLLTELLREIDGYRLSTFMYKDRGKKLVMGPAWDFNLSLGNADYIDGWKTEGWYYEDLPENDCYIGCGVRDWYVRLLEDEAYVQRMQQRWWTYRQGMFSEAHLSGLINDKQQELQEAQQRNFERWPILGEYVWPNYFVANTWEEELDWMENWLLERLAWMDSQMGEAPVDPEELELGYFWHFTEDMPNDTPLTELASTYAAGEGNDAIIQFESALSGYPFNDAHPDWRKASMERRNKPTALNYRAEANNEEAFDETLMRGLQTRQPFTGDGGENTLIFHFPTASYGGLLFSFAAMDEGAADQIRLDYA